MAARIGPRTRQLLLRRRSAPGATLLALAAGAAAAGCWPPAFAAAGQPPHEAAAAAALAVPLAGVLSGPWALLAVTGIATLACTTALIRQAYVFSVGYGLAIAMQSAALLLAFAGPGAPLAAVLHTVGGFLHGVRLAWFLLWRERCVAGWRARLEAFDKTPRAWRGPLIVMTSLFYALLASPLLFAARRPLLAGSGAAAWALYAGLAVQYFGLILEGVADYTKAAFKSQPAKADKFMETGVWARCRHPNYLGELLFWAGTFVAGAPSFGLNPVAWACGLLGQAGIFFIMTSATKRLDKKQKEKYGEEPGYEAYLARSGALLPKLA